jgi:hypothetical protein
VTDTLDLVEQLATAAAAAVRARRGAIEAGGAGALQAITIELEPVNRGAVTPASMYLQWEQTVRRAS